MHSDATTPEMLPGVHSREVSSRSHSSPSALGQGVGDLIALQGHRPGAAQGVHPGEGEGGRGAVQAQVVALGLACGQGGVGPHAQGLARPAAEDPHLQVQVVGGPQGHGGGVAGDRQPLHEDAASGHRLRRHEVDLVQPPALVVVGVVGQRGGRQQDHRQQSQGRHRQEGAPGLLSPATLGLPVGTVCSAVPVAAEQGQSKGKPESELRAAARRHGLTLKELADRMGVNYGYLSSVASGRRPWTPMLRERAMAVLGEVPGQGIVYRQGGLVKGESSYIRERARALGMSLKELAGHVGVGSRLPAAGRYFRKGLKC